MTVSGGLPAKLSGDSGADELHGTDAADELRGRDGNDLLAAVGGAGTDRVAADQLDAVAPGCETVERTTVQPPATGAEGDETPPLLAVQAPKAIRLRNGRIALRARSLEVGEVSASAFLAVSGVRLRVKAVSREVPAQTWQKVTLRLSRAQVRRVRRARGGRLTVAVIASDRAGNASAPKTVRIRLRL